MTCTRSAAHAANNEDAHKTPPETGIKRRGQERGTCPPQHVLPKFLTRCITADFLIIVGYISPTLLANGNGELSGAGDTCRRSYGVMLDVAKSDVTKLLSNEHKGYTANDNGHRLHSLISHKNIYRFVFRRPPKKKTNNH